MSPLNRLHAFVTRQHEAPALGVIRIAVGTLAFAKALLLIPTVVRFVDPATVRLPLVPGMPAAGSTYLGVTLAIWLAASALFAAGWKTRTAGLVLVGAMAAVLMVDQQFYASHLYLLGLVCLLLTLADSGAYHSVDAPRRLGTASTPVWPAVLLQLQLSIVYGFAAIAKINPTYLAGTMIAGTLREKTSLLARVLEHSQVAVAFALVTILVELFLAVALWIPRYRRDAFVVGALFHAGIVATVSPVPELAVFALLSLALYLLFLDAAPRSRIVVWDDTCTFCALTVRWLQRLDWLGVHQFRGSSDAAVLAAHGISREEADEALQVVTVSGRASGFTAVRLILETLPLTFLLAPLASLPIVQRAGDRAYRRIAARRRCALTPAAEAQQLVPVAELPR